MATKFHESNTNIEVNLFIQEQCYCYGAKLSRSANGGRARATAKVVFSELRANRCVT